MLAALATTGYARPNIAIVGSHNVFGQPYPIGELQALLTTTWQTVSSDNATAEQVATATAFVEAPFDMLDHAAAGTLYQFSFTGVPDDEIANVPSHFAVANCHQSSVAIAEYVLAATLEWTVQLRAMDARLRNCSWRSAPPGNDCTAAGARITHGQLSNRTIGILGYGHIGAAIASRAAAFGTRMIATTVDPPAEPPAPLAWIGDDSDNARLFAEADFVVGTSRLSCNPLDLAQCADPPRTLLPSRPNPPLTQCVLFTSPTPPCGAVCTPLLNATRGLVDAALLAHMRRDAVLVNIARGPIVDEAALYAALSAGRIGGAILDVWWHPIFELPDGPSARFTSCSDRRPLARAMWTGRDGAGGDSRHPALATAFAPHALPSSRNPAPARPAPPAPPHLTPPHKQPPGAGGVGPSAWPSSYRFDELPNVIMTAHDSGETAGAAAESVREVATNLDRLARGLPPLNVVRNASARAAAAAAPWPWWTW